MVVKHFGKSEHDEIQGFAMLGKRSIRNSVPQSALQTVRAAVLNGEPAVARANIAASQRPTATRMVMRGFLTRSTTTTRSKNQVRIRIRGTTTRWCRGAATFRLRLRMLPLNGVAVYIRTGLHSADQTTLGHRTVFVMS